MMINFDRIDDPSTQSSDDPFCQHVCHLFTQLSMMVLLKLHAGEPVEEDWDALMLSNIQQVLQEQGLMRKRNTHAAGSRITGEKSFRTTIRPGAALPRGGVPRRRGYSFGLAVRTPAAQRRIAVAQQGGGVLLPARRASLQTDRRTTFSDAELQALKQAKCPVTLVAHRIIRSMTTRSRARGWKTPAPVQARAYHALEQGLAAYHDAMKMKEVPIPFAFVQINALMLITFNLLAPVAIACFSSTYSMSMITTSVVVGAFCAMWLVANEMEDPFGTEANHLDLRQFHAQFAGSLTDMRAWFPEDAWIVSSGPWKAPTDAAKRAGTWDVDSTQWSEGIMCVAHPRSTPAPRSAPASALQPSPADNCWCSQALAGWGG
jgi:hypothetical protein